MNIPSSSQHRESHSEFERQINGLPLSLLKNLEVMYPGIMQIALNPDPRGMNEHQRELNELRLKIKKALVEKQNIDEKYPVVRIDGGNAEYPITSSLPDAVHEMIFPGSLSRRAENFQRDHILNVAKDIDDRQRNPKKNGLDDFFSDVERDLKEKELQSERTTIARMIEETLNEVSPLNRVRKNLVIGSGEALFRFPNYGRSVAEKMTVSGREIDISGNNSPELGTEQAMIYQDDKQGKMVVSYITADKKGQESQKLVDAAMALNSFYVSKTNKGRLNANEMSEYENNYLLVEQRDKKVKERMAFRTRNTIIDWKKNLLTTASVGDQFCIVLSQEGKVKRMATRQFKAAQIKKVFNDEGVQVAEHFDKKMELPEIASEVIRKAGRSGEEAKIQQETILFEDSDSIVFAGPDLFFNLVSANDLQPGKNADSVFKEKLEAFLSDDRNKDLSLSEKITKAMEKMRNGKKPVHIVVINGK